MKNLIINIAKTWHFICEKLKVSITNLAWTWNNKKAISIVLWRNKYIILENIWNNKWYIITSIILVLIFKKSVSLFLLLMDWPQFIALQWAGVVSCLVRLTITSWKHNYEFSFRDLIKWVLIGTMLAFISNYLLLVMLMFLTIKDIIYFPVIANIISKYTPVLYMNEPSNETKDLVSYDRKTTRRYYKFPSPSREEMEWERTGTLTDTSGPGPSSSQSHLHSTHMTGTNVSNARLEHLEKMFPTHVAGKGRGWGYFGELDKEVIWNLLKDLNTLEKNPYCLDGFNIPPKKHEPMLGLRSSFWASILNKYDEKTTGVDVTNVETEEWPLRPRPPVVKSKPFPHDTLMDIVTNSGTRKEQKETCVYIMRSLKDAMQDPDNYPSKKDTEYWKFMHQFLAARHHYQVHLLNDEDD